MAARGLMKDVFHYLQPAYNEAGAEAGQNAALHIRKKDNRLMDQSVSDVLREKARRIREGIVNALGLGRPGHLGGCSVYGATKSGVVALTRAMAVEWAQHNIRANAMSPGHIATPLTTVTWEHPTRSAWLRDRIAMRRPGRPEELVGMCVMLASDAGAYMTGQAYHIDGGCLCGGDPWDFDTAYPGDKYETASMDNISRSYYVDLRTINSLGRIRRFVGFCGLAMRSKRSARLSLAI